MDKDTKADTSNTSGPKDGGDRQPSGDKKDSSKDKGASNGGDSSRAPASAGPGSTLKTDDMAGHDSAPPPTVIANTAGAPQVPQTNNNPNPNPTTNPACQFCTQVLQNQQAGKANVNISIKTK